ncbi:TetR/AcrR family transcriptional regulator C-terminal domain-containing protein [Mycolicibacter sinensis]|uniref:TetR family transcriptional regulator n=1 Tax=Mycolicibacter sinensis (strain JDM601) TaxID=875328 RepID=A0A1A2XX99_MYCSD|nr:TetR/AcrR family transcriptional regulator C-terminal domain-containing protein [Mycolicibacter sinensis]OBH19863.1 TetR family transcriptional regulator [Mycolicibacter sinensis]OBI30384.1 TetR family transcriptional regulator [Mycolicibacter sinensis]
MQLHKPDPKQEIVAAAAGILDNYGIADLSMRRLARELNVSPSALYWHFANKQQLLGAVADRVLGPACTDPGPGSWQWRIQTVCARLRDALLSHTDGAELVSASLAAGQSQAAADIVALLAQAATAAGVHPDQAGQVARTVVYYVLGFTADEQSRLQWDAAGAADIAPDADPGSAFAFGLGLLIDGLAVRAGLAV